MSYVFYLGSAVLALALLSPCHLAAAANPINKVELIRGVVADRLAMADTGTLQTPVMFRELRVKVELPSGRAFRDGILIIAHDQATKRFWWTFGSGGPPPYRMDQAEWFASHCAVYETEDSMIVFEVVSAQLNVKEHRGLLARDLDEAQQKAMEEIGAQTNFEKQGYFGPPGKTTKLPPQIPLKFYEAELVPYFRDYRVQVLSARRAGNGWRLVLRCEWDQEVILDENFAIVSTRRLDAKE